MQELVHLAGLRLYRLKDGVQRPSDEAPVWPVRLLSQCEAKPYEDDPAFCKDARDVLIALVRPQSFECGKLDESVKCISPDALETYEDLSQVVDLRGEHAAHAQQLCAVFYKKLIDSLRARSSLPALPRSHRHGHYFGDKVVIKCLRQMQLPSSPPRAPSAVAAQDLQTPRGRAISVFSRSSSSPSQLVAQSSQSPAQQRGTSGVKRSRSPLQDDEGRSRPASSSSSSSSSSNNNSNHSSATPPPENGAQRASVDSTAPSQPVAAQDGGDQRGAADAEHYTVLVRMLR
jgi:hypothetical protein